MEAEDQEYALGIMEELMKKPASLPFVKPVDADDEDAANYYVKIRRPMDLGTIQGKLLTNEYRNLAEWEKDISLIWSNAERFYGKNDLTTAMAYEFRNHFEKITADPIPDNTKAWFNEVTNLQKKLDDIISRAPTNLSKYWKKEIKIKALPKMSIREVKNLVTASAKLTDQSDARSMFSIISDLNPNVTAYSENVQLDLDTVTPKTHWALEWYIRRRFEEEGLEYPK